MKYNRLIPRAARVANPEVDERRASGRTTARALRCLANAIESPGSAQHLNDHEGGNDHALSLRVMAIARALELEHIAVDSVNRTVTSRHFTNNPWEIE